MGKNNSTRNAILTLKNGRLKYLKADIKCRSNGRFEKFIEDSFGAMVEEFDRYIELEHVNQKTNDLPWWFNERATLGFFIGGLMKNNKNTFLQEFSCKKGKGNIRTGRPDLYINHDGDRYLMESKFCFTKIDSKTEGYKKWAQDALEHQANFYHENDEDLSKFIPRKNVFSLCFESLWCNEKTKNSGTIEKILEKNGWLQASTFFQDKELDYAYYGVVALSNEALRDKGIGQYCGYWYPALAVGGCKNK
ncbi:MAG: hypothetical protein ABIJ56_07725 [Pseudomonadota bacterium]